ncbi:CopD family protein [Reichenbachiella agarivorans]|uniref:Protoporphyrinogen IX oxidase n=1 Tax=Reichenbachiella agarivorans TaxID=2979464 RepID=A0ABY6CK66_9BACT|nr:CopD family protein [Reichenbachiella agarivorans]UXP30882.1 CopD family protein [Reichenbachiella agarivorans]
MIYLYLKATHIVFVVTWFAGLFYMVRLFIYSTESVQKQEPEKSILSKQLLLMQSRLWYIITWPSAIITLFLGGWLAYLMNYWQQPWFHVKLTLVIGLYIYHIICGRLHQQMARGIFKYTSKQYRIWNEISTLFLFAIVFVVVLKNAFSWIWGVAGIVALGILLMLGIKLYKTLRKDD